MIKIAETFPNREIVATLSRQLGWSHFVEIITIKDDLRGTADRSDPVPIDGRGTRGVAGTWCRWRPRRDVPDRASFQEPVGKETPRSRGTRPESAGRGGG